LLQAQNNDRPWGRRETRPDDGPAVEVELLKSKPLRAPCTMGGAIGFAAVIVVLGIFLPRVLHALEAFLLLLFEKATLFLQHLRF
jgi:hypothetical protein